jgi:NAD(P)-dependent dehydrogenase (short-subunit alcohol dehydrogenase family)/quinol monooxygenase YgiN
MSRLAGKTALVTGATSGIGRAVAERLAGEGAQVILSGRDLDRGEQVVAAIRSSGGSARFVRADLAKLEDVKRLAAESGQADILVNNAGVFPFGPTSDTGEEAFDLAFDVNVKAPFFLTAAIAPQMIARGGGAIINISTMVASFGLNGMATYGASKAAIELLTKAWTDEYGPGGIRVNAVAPGPTRTPGTEPMGAALNQMAATLPARRAANAEQIASVVAFLASEESRFIYGAWCRPTAAGSPSDGPHTRPPGMHDPGAHARAHPRRPDIKHARPATEGVDMAVTLGVLALLEAKPEKGSDLAAFLEGGRAIAAAEQGTVTWYAFKLEDSTYGIFDTFESADARNAHLGGEIPRALAQVGPELLAKDPEIHLVDVLALK